MLIFVNYKFVYVVEWKMSNLMGHSDINIDHSIPRAEPHITSATKVQSHHLLFYCFSQNEQK